MITHTPAQEQKTKGRMKYQLYLCLQKQQQHHAHPFTHMHTKLSNGKTHQSIDFREMLVINDPVVKVNSFLVMSPVKSWSATAQLLVMCCYEKVYNKWISTVLGLAPLLHTHHHETLSIKTSQYTYISIFHRKLQYSAVMNRVLHKVVYELV